MTNAKACTNSQSNINSKEHMAQEMAVPFLGRIPVDPQIAQSCDEGKPFVYHYSKTLATKKFKDILQKIMDRKDQNKENITSS